MKKALTIAKWEFFEKVKRKSFIASLIITPLIVLLIGLSTGLLMETPTKSPVALGILDTTNEFRNILIEKLESQRLDDGQPAFILLNLFRKNESIDQQKVENDIKVRNRSIRGYIFISETADDGLIFELRNCCSIFDDEFEKIEGVVREAVIERQLAQIGINTTFVEKLIESSALRRIDVSPNSRNESDLIKIFFTGYVFIMLLLMMILFAGGMFVRSVVEEKSNRIMEILLSSCKINHLLTGKILGLSWLGLFQLLIWTIFGYVMLENDLLTLDLEGNQLLQLLYFLLGYTIYTAIFVGLGSIVNSEHDAQQITGNISLVLIVPIIISTQVIQNPDSLLATLLSYFPLTASPVMLLRLNIYTPPVWEIISSIIILILSIYIVIFISSKIFRVGILYYGQRPSMKELFGWLKD